MSLTDKLTDKQLTDKINMGALICKKIKRIYFRDIKWVDCYKDVAAKFNQLKTIMLNFFSSKDESEVLQLLMSYSDDDIRDAFDMHGQK